MNKPRVFIDSDVLFAGSASPSQHSASLIVLRMAEITLIEGICSEQVLIECERNLAVKFPKALPQFRLLVQRCLTVVPVPSVEDVVKLAGQADQKDTPILAAALNNHCTHLLTFNTRHFRPIETKLVVQTPGDFLKSVRGWLSLLAPNGDSP